MKTVAANSRNPAGETSVAATVAAEDLRVGDFVAILNQSLEVPSFYWCPEVSGLDPREMVRLTFATRDGGTPLKVQAACLPFVLLRTHDGQARTADVRHVQFVRLNRRYAKLVWKQLGKKPSGDAGFEC